jgi:hypothetical protein
MKKFQNEMKKYLWNKRDIFYGYIFINIFKTHSLEGLEPTFFIGIFLNRISGVKPILALNYLKLSNFILIYLPLK